MNIAKVVLQNIAKGSGELAESLPDDPFKKQRQTLSNASVTLNAILSEGQKEVKKAISIERRAALKAKITQIKTKAATGSQNGLKGVGFAAGCTVYILKACFEAVKDPIVEGYQKA